MGKKSETTIQGLNIIPTDVLSDETSPSEDINRDLEAQLAMWTNFQFPNSSTTHSSSSNNLNLKVDADDEHQRFFSPERDTASKSRHKAVPVEDFTSGHFFGEVGASLAGPATSSHVKFPHFHQHLPHGNKNTHDNNNNNSINNAMNNRNNFENDHNDQINELFSFFPPGDMNLNSPLVDPFLNSDIAAGANGFGQFPPLTISDQRENGHPHPHSPQPSAFSGHVQQMQMQTIDPATTTLGHRATISLPTSTSPAKRQKAKSHGGPGGISSIVIPVDRDYTAPDSAFGDDEMDHDRRDHDDPSNSNGSSNYDDSGLSLLDASGNPISAAEDKRRRNTLASARFRQKKKEREAAMERKAKDLEGCVVRLERECDSLRKENRMLRGLLVDGGPAPNSSAPASIVGNVDLSNGNNLGAASAGASVALLEELVRLLKANSGVLGGVPGQATSTPPNGRTGTTTGKRKRGAGN